ncbi:hypothetical protein [Mycobacterium montefiorense]|uniref:hypothetical protein n=2 Tax=Mycobacterium montefiorense TaxID=154654 RepID=UPI002230EAE2|nr:hypothetical protein [Mycobacterium montefiorense]
MTFTYEEINTFMSAHDSDDSHNAETKPETDTRGQARQASGSDVELSEEGREEVHQMVEAYEDKPTVTLPGTGGTITGTAINDWLDDEGNPKFGDPDEHPSEDQTDAADSD